MDKFKAKVVEITDEKAAKRAALKKRLEDAAAAATAAKNAAAAARAEAERVVENEAATDDDEPSEAEAASQKAKAQSARDRINVLRSGAKLEADAELEQAMSELHKAELERAWADGKAKGKAEGVAEGVKAGKAKGLAEGLAEGKAEAEREALAKAHANERASAVARREADELDASERSAAAADAEATIERFEAIDAEMAEKGLSADLVMIYPIEQAPDAGSAGSGGGSGVFSLSSSADGITRREELRRQLLYDLAQAKLRVVKQPSIDGKSMLVKISAPLERLKTEAMRQGIEMQLDADVAKQEADAMRVTKLNEERLSRSQRTVQRCQRCCKQAAFNFLAIFLGTDSQRSYRDYSRAETADTWFRGGSKEGRLFSPLERGRLIFSICEGPKEMKGGGAELDLDDLVNSKVLSSFLFLHSASKEPLMRHWGTITVSKIGPIQSEQALATANDVVRVGMWALLGIIYLLYLVKRSNDFMFGLILLGCLVGAAMLGMLTQPLDDVRDYFGEKIAFYFGWIEFYSRHLWLLSFASMVIVMLIRLPGKGSLDGASMRAWADMAYCVVIALWTTFFSETWKQRNAVFAHVWDVEDFDAEEDPRPEFLKAFYSGRWRSKEYNQVRGGKQGVADARAGKPAEERKKAGGLRACCGRIRRLLGRLCGMVCCLAPHGSMETRQGFFTPDRRFIEVNGAAMPDAKYHKTFPRSLRLRALCCAIPTLLFFFALMLSGVLGVLVFKLLMGVEPEVRAAHSPPCPHPQVLPLCIHSTAQPCYAAHSRALLTGRARLSPPSAVRVDQRKHDPLAGAHCSLCCLDLCYERRLQEGRSRLQ